MIRKLRKRRRRFWSDKDVKVLIRLAQRRMPVWRMVYWLGRTEGAIRVKAMSLGLSLETREGVLARTMQFQEAAE